MSDEQNQSTTIGNRKGGQSNRKKRPPNKSLETPIKEGDTTSAFYWIFFILAKVIHSEASFTQEEFETFGKAFTELANRIKPLKYIILFATPLASVGAIWDKVERLLKGIKPRAKKAPKPTGEEHPSGPAVEIVK